MIVLFAGCILCMNVASYILDLFFKKYFTSFNMWTFLKISV